MSTVSIIRADNMVVVDGRALPVDLSALDPGIHAVQWAGEAGHVEYCYGTGVVPLTSLAEYGWVLAAWEAARDEADAPAPEPTPEELAAQVRAERDARLAACDWTQLADAPLTEAGRTAWVEYRQALRDVPQQAGFPGAVQWPGAPGDDAAQGQEE